MRRFPREQRLGPTLMARLQNKSDSELAMIADSSLFALGRTITHPDRDKLRDALNDLFIIEGVLEVLSARH